MKLKPILVSLAVSAVLSAPAYAAKKAPPAVTLPSGVVVQTLQEGTGAQPKASNVVKVHYRGTLDNGTEFDSSYSRGKPAEFPLSRVIPCWTQGLQTMKVGGKARLTCPADTAYGRREVGPIPANSTLNFDVELLEIK
jgi:FKBP-type peptidyl-prolyl cis-trans isomerase FkpA